MTTPTASLPIEALIFDMDGLLVESEALTGEALDELLRQHDCTIDWIPELEERLMGRRMTEILPVVADICGITTPPEELLESLEASRLIVMRGRLRAYPGALDLIAFGRSLGLSLALTTSGRRSYVDATLAEVQLTGCFDVEVTGEEVERGKPAPDGYLLAASRLGVPPAACVVFEDAPNGIAAAVAAGMRAAAVPNVYSQALTFAVAPDAVLPDLRAAIPWLQGLGVSDRSVRELTIPVSRG